MQAATKAQVSGIGDTGAVVVETAPAAVEGRGQKVRAMLKARLGDEIYSSWFKSLEFESFDGRIVKVSVPVKFVRNWIQEHYADHLLACSRIEFATAERVDVIWRQPGSAAQRNGEARAAEAPAAGSQLPLASPQAELPQRNVGFRVPTPPAQRTSAGGLEGSPLDPRYTFDSFVVGASNRMAHAGATQVAETVMSDAPGYNPLYLHSSVGLGKSHLLQAIAWEVRGALRRPRCFI